MSPLRTPPTTLYQSRWISAAEDCPERRLDQNRAGSGMVRPPRRGSCDPSKNSSQCPLPIKVQHHHPISLSAGQRRPSLTKKTCFRNCGKAERKRGLLYHPPENFRFCFSPTDLWTCVENCYSSNSSEEDEGAAEGIPLAQPLMDMPEPEPEAQPFMRHPDEHCGLSLSTTLEEEGDHCLGELPADKLNRKDVTQLDDAFLEDPEALDNVASSSKDEPGPPCFC
ncbi:uncharacterized protein LOC127035293 isoform X1 [Gopherus flavomarginatus]|uniref:uncharacterized protein LOC127035293 isoform X1 n=1 Tax=Gopherus flavomarginatus TaxID=286002 RepID=UPI0021CC41FD|nr:uncharacterized protein LOC127035293 isoform X1 [Gopherus flavomarginatus]